MDTKQKKLLGAGRVSSTTYGPGETVEQDPLHCDSKKWETLLDAGLKHIMACVQECPQHSTKRRSYTPQTGERVLDTSKDFFRQKPHSDFCNAPCTEERSDGLQVAKNDDQTAGYFAMVSAGTEMRL